MHGVYNMCLCAHVEGIAVESGSSSSSRERCERSAKPLSGVSV